MQDGVYQQGAQDRLQKVIVSHGRFPALLYCPNCCLAYDLDGNPARGKYFDKDYTCLANGVFIWGRLVTDKKDLAIKNVR